jgi:hypothetical protein
MRLGRYGDPNMKKARKNDDGEEGGGKERKDREDRDRKTNKKWKGEDRRGRY